MPTIPQYQWIKCTEHAAFAPRDGGGALTYKNKMWLLGGWNPDDKVNFPKICNSEVWNSTDGITWNLILKQAPWEGRHCSGYVLFKGKMFIVGGDPNQRHYQQDVWCSDDGVKWDLVTDTVPWHPRSLQYTVVHNDKIFVMGGQTIPDFAPAEERFCADVWSSPDGKNWTKILDNAPWAPRSQIGGTAIKDGKIWIMGGGTYDTPKIRQRLFYNDVWNSPDGINWTCVNKSAPWFPRQFHDVAVFDNRLWVMEGWNEKPAPGETLGPDGNRKDVWHSENGVDWHEVPNTPWLHRHAASVFVYDNALWMVAGNNMTSDAWKLVRKA